MSRSQNKRSLCCISRQTLGNNKFVARLRIRYVLTNVTISKTGPTGEARVGVGGVRTAAGIVLPVTATSHNPNPQLKCKRPKDSTHGSCLTPPPWSDCCLCSSRPKKPHARHLPHPPPWSDCCLCSSQKKSNVSSQCPALQFPSNKRTGMYVFSSP